MDCIRLLTENDMPQAHHIWDVCFGDPPEFTKWYFDTRVTPERIIGLFESGELISDALMIPYTVRLRGKTAQAPYIVGAATKPEHRRKGYMERVLKEALTHMRDAGAGVTFLHPFRDSFYRRLGWENATGMLEYTLSADKLKALRESGDFEPVESGHSGRLWPQYTAMASRADPALVRVERECRYRIEETLMEGGFGVQGKNAYALCGLSNGRIDVHELIYNGMDDIYPLLFEIALVPGAREVSFALPSWEAPPERLADCGPPKLAPYMMMRVVDVEEALTGLAFNAELNGAVTLYITDALCPWNEGAFRVALENGVSAVRPSNKEAGDADAQMDITTLAMLLSGYSSFGEAVANGRALVKSENKLLNSALTRLNGFILEKY